MKVIQYVDVEAYSCIKKIFFKIILPSQSPWQRNFILCSVGDSFAQLMMTADNVWFIAFSLLTGKYGFWFDVVKWESMFMWEITSSC
jgi:hypothetical protein